MPAPSFPEPPIDGRSALLALFHFHESAPRVDDPKWMELMKKSLRELKPDAHYTSLAVRFSADFSVGPREGKIRAVNHVSRILWVQERNSLAASFTTLLPTLFPDQNQLTSAEEPVALQVARLTTRSLT